MLWITTRTSKRSFSLFQILIYFVSEYWTVVIILWLRCLAFLIPTIYNIIHNHSCMVYRWICNYNNTQLNLNRKPQRILLVYIYKLFYYIMLFSCLLRWYIIINLYYSFSYTFFSLHFILLFLYIKIVSVCYYKREKKETLKLYILWRTKGTNILLFKIIKSFLFLSYSYICALSIFTKQPVF